MEKLDLSRQEEASLEDDEFEEMLQNFPKERNWVSGFLYFCQGFWVADLSIRSQVSFSQNFLARDNDLVLASCPKSGTTWLKALAYSIVNRSRFALSNANNPLLKLNPHDLVPYVDMDLYSRYQPIYFENIPEPRLLCTHTPFESLPPSFKSSNCKIVYICRNPMDTFVSLWHFVSKFESETELAPIQECFDKFCRGVHVFGPFWDHILGYWKASLETPHKVLFIKYEDVKNDVVFYIKHIAEFLGFPFSEEEERQGLIKEIAEVCSFEKMKNLKVNIDGKHHSGKPNKNLFRKGEVGDWKNYFTPSMIERMEKLIHDKFKNSNLVFNFSP
ncbi:Sulfotransferase domain containing protein [Trema orientale]|uniref:Sulfotransferase n=1 Tax=Trema orientale TaxID=63057 RepID=A0A2P5FN98_TREOI|nr:Sulfotransferase domain containing protein [Trema orientale]